MNLERHEMYVVFQNEDGPSATNLAVMELFDMLYLF